MAIDEALERFVGNQTTQASMSKEAPPIVEPIIDGPVQSVTPTNVDNLLVAKRPAVQSEEPSMYFTKVEIGAMFKKEHEKSSRTSTAFYLKSPYSDKVATKQYPPEYKVSNF